MYTESKAPGDHTIKIFPDGDTYYTELLSPSGVLLDRRAFADYGSAQDQAFVWFQALGRYLPAPTLPTVSRVTY